MVKFKSLGDGAYQPIMATGTGFSFGEGTFVTCWHCVSEPLDDDEVYGIPVSVNGTSYAGVAVLSDVCQDANGADLAFAVLNIDSNIGFQLATEPAAWGEEVVSFCYPLTENTVSPDSGEALIKTHARVFRGYVISAAVDDLHGRLRSEYYELDMPAPKWSSGSPLFRIDPFQVVGVVQGERNTSVSGEDFGLKYSVAHHLNVLRNAKCSVTDDIPLSEYLDAKRKN